MTIELTRREWLGGITGAGAGLTGLTQADAAVAAREETREPFLFSLNTSTIRGQKIPIDREVTIAAKAGYHVIEPWIEELEEYVRAGGSLRDLRKRIEDAGLGVESSIGFSEWIVDDQGRRKKGLERARRDMDLVRQIGGKRIAAPPVGATNQADMPLLRVAERYRALLEVGDKLGIVPQIEVWGFSRTLSRLGECALAAIESGHPKACVLADVYHLHKGGSGFAGVRLLSAGAMQIFHLNDYPAKPPRAQITDADRIYPGDGVAPLTALLRDLRRLGFRGVLSLELFNREYWKQDALTVARTGLEKMRAVARASLRSP
jgi:sugar phosphate isomerase/epimerase